MVISEDRINANYTRWIENLKKYGCYSEQMIADKGYAIRDAPFCMSASGGAAFRGGLLDVVLNNLLPLAYNLNKLFEKKNKFLAVDIASIMRVFLLQHIAKADMYVVQTQSWRIKNGQYYEFNTMLPTCMKCGERSAYLAQLYGIRLTEDEYEAMRAVEYDTEEQVRYSSPLAMLSVSVNMFVDKELKERFKMEERMNNSQMEK